MIEEIAKMEYLEDSYMGVHRKIDDMRAGTWGYNAFASTSQAVVYTVASNKLFYCDTLIINNDGTDAGGNAVIIYDSADTSVPVLKVWLGPTESILVTGLKGMVFSTGVYGAPTVASGMQVTACGLLVDSRDKI